MSNTRLVVVSFASIASPPRQRRDQLLRVRDHGRVDDAPAPRRCRRIQAGGRFHLARSSERSVTCITAGPIARARLRSPPPAPAPEVIPEAAHRLELRFLQLELRFQHVGLRARIVMRRSKSASCRRRARSISSSCRRCSRSACCCLKLLGEACDSRGARATGRATGNKPAHARRSRDCPGIPPAPAVVPCVRSAAS